MLAVLIEIGLTIGGVPNQRFVHVIKLILLGYEREILVARSTSKRNQHKHFAMMTKIAALIRENPGNVNIIERKIHGCISTRPYQILGGKINIFG
jgi:hypothetical protein